MKAGVFIDMKNNVYIECIDKNTKSKHCIRIDTIVAVSAASDGSIITTENQQYSIIEDYAMITKRLFKQEITPKSSIDYTCFLKT